MRTPEEITKDKKRWIAKTIDGKTLEFFPVFKVVDNGEVECQYCIIKAGGVEYKLNFDLLLMLVYTVDKEEERRKLMMAMVKNVRHLKYEVNSILTNEEKQSGTAVRIVEIPIDEAIVEIAKQEAKNIEKKRVFMSTLKT